MKFDDILDAKLYALELIKDSPLVLYVTFYDPLHQWLATVADEWNPVLQLVLNILALLFGIARITPIIKGWIGKSDPEPDDIETK
jgi:hypothetical protein